MPRRPQPRSPAPTGAEIDDQARTRGRLLETAGRIFAEKGFYQATGKEICRRAHANAAAINYHFGGIEGLYAAVVREAHRRLLAFDELSAAVASSGDAESRLRAFFTLMVRALTGPASSSWVLRIIAREIVATTPAVESIRSREVLPKARLLRQIISQLMGLPPRHPAVARTMLSVFAPCFMLMVGDRRLLPRAFSGLGLRQADAPGLIDHMLGFTLAGIAGQSAE